MSDFHPLEWNALINRARAALRAELACQAAAGDAGDCSNCPLAGADDRPGSCCLHRFRRTQRRLSALVRSAPPPHRHQLRRTLDALELAFRQGRQPGANR
jgi:hypothetical protein